MDTLKKFYEAFSSDSAMRERAEILYGKFKDANMDESTIAAKIAAFAKSEGYEFTAEELTVYAKTKKELSDDELQAVAGGAFNQNECLCTVGGSGTNNLTGIACVCAVPGSGDVSVDKSKCTALLCVISGFIAPVGEVH